jgi:hypothetical protein
MELAGQDGEFFYACGSNLGKKHFFVCLGSIVDLCVFVIHRLAVTVLYRYCLEYLTKMNLVYA